MPLQATSGAASYDAFGGGVAVVPNYIEDVFSTWLYTGNGSTQTITNGIDLAGEGGLVWLKYRSNDSQSHRLFDTSRGVTNSISSNNTNAQQTSAVSLTNFFADGFRIGDDPGINFSGVTAASWTFRKQPKFFDCVTYTGTGAGNTISHNLGSKPGCIIIKRTNSTGDWFVVSRKADNDYALFSNTGTGLNQTAAANSSTAGGEFSATTINIGALNSSNNINASGGTYVAYLFAHDAGGFGLTGTDNVISCGSFTTDGSYNVSVTLGYEPQWIMIKRVSGGTGNWDIFDSMRGMPATGLSPTYTGLQNLFANLSNAEGENNGPHPTATGFNVTNYGVASTPYIYIAIRRGPMKVPTSGTSVFAPALGTSASTIPTFVTNFPVDLGFYHSRANTADWYLSSRLQGGGTLNTNTTYAEAAPDANYAFDSNTGWGKNFNSDKASSNFRRAPGFFDEVCYTGNSTARTINHNLAAVPELMILKGRSSGTAGFSWGVYQKDLGASNELYLNTTDAVQGTSAFNDTAPTASVFSVGAGYTNFGGQTYVVYLFASCPGVSKVGSYTGTGTTQTINCGFTGGARFVLIKRTDSTGDWYVWDSARGIVAGNDPYLLLNSAAAEVTSTDYIDTAATGFEISSTAPAAINASGGTFIFLAIA